MPALDKKSQAAQKRRRKIFYMILCITVFFLAPLVAEALDTIIRSVLSGSGNPVFDFSYIRCVRLLLEQGQRLMLASAFGVLMACFLLLILYRPDAGFDGTDETEAAHGIRIPVAVGNGQHGTARFMTEKELGEEFPTVSYNGNGTVKDLPRTAGIIVDYRKVGRAEKIKYLAGPVNVEILGATRSGKTRRLLMPSIWLDLQAGVNLLVIDVKGELCAFTAPFAESMGYEVRTLDFRNPERSMHFNSLDEITGLLAGGKIPEAVNKAWDIVSVLVGEPKGERIWTDGECAAIAAAILIVAQDAPEGCRNLTNVYYFLAYMCESEPETGEMPINSYMENLPYSHPARGAFQVAKIAPFRTRSSFFTSALATLRLFTDWNVADVMGKSDYRLSDTDERKVVTYLILPDEKTTFHAIGAIYMKQYYESLVEQALKNGGRLKRRFIFRADEIGNFPVIPGLGTMLSAGAGRNIFFELVLQDYQQLESKYKDDFRNIRTNCQLTICLKATDVETTKEISTRLGNYTVQVNSVSTSIGSGRGDSSSYSGSSNMAGRPLLYPDEIAAIEKPDALLLYGGKKAVTNLPDLSEYYANKAFGMGDEAFNQKLFLERLAGRPAREIPAPKLWGIWEQEKKGMPALEEKKVSFL